MTKNKYIKLLKTKGISFKERIEILEVKNSLNKYEMRELRLYIMILDIILEEIAAVKNINLEKLKGAKNVSEKPGRIYKRALFSIYSLIGKTYKEATNATT